MLNKKILLVFMVFSLMIPGAMAEPSEYDLDISRGLIPGVEPWGLIGHNEDTQTTEHTIWELSSRYPFPPAPSIMTVSSSDVDDTNGGNGSWLVVIQGLDVNYNELEEVVILNGQNPVNTTNQFYRINYWQILGAGSSGSNEGRLYIGTGAVVGGIPANIYGIIEAGYGNTMTGVYTVPANHTLYITRLWLTTFTNKQFEIYGYAWTAPSGGVGGNMTYFKKFEAHLGESFVERHIAPVIAIPETSSIEYTVESDQAGGQVNIEIRGVLVNESEVDSGLTWGDINWLAGIIWLVLTGLGYAVQQKPILLFSGLIGLVLGLYVLSSSGMIGVIILLFSFYLLYEGTGTE